MKKNAFEFLLILVGLLSILVALTSDWFHPGSPGIGFEQSALMIIGLILILIALRYLWLPDQARWDGILFVGYLAGLMVAGLRGGYVYHLNEAVLFGMNSFSVRDLVVNVAGFIPLGFLGVSLMRHRIQATASLRLLIMATLLGFVASLFIEVGQFLWVPGRFSSLVDLSANTLGALIGALSYLQIKGLRLSTTGKA